ncbi:hypothetical protein D3C81_1443590 [compost metagenome]
MVAAAAQQIQGLIEYPPADAERDAAKLFLVLEPVNAPHELELAVIAAVRSNHEVLILIKQQLVWGRDSAG